MAELTSDSTIKRPVAVLEMKVAEKSSEGLQTGSYTTLDTIVPGYISDCYCLYLPHGLNDTTGKSYYKMNMGTLTVTNDAELYTILYRGVQTDSANINDIVSAYYYGILLKMNNQYLMMIED